MAQKIKQLLTKQDFLQYLTSSRDVVIEKLRDEGMNDEQIKEFLKEELSKFVKDDANIGMVKLTYAPMCTLVENFKFRDFISRSWVYRPKVMNESDFNVLREQGKFPTDMAGVTQKDGYIFYDPCFLSESLTREAKRQQFYVSKDQNILYGKLTRVKYVPIDEQRISLLDKSKGIIDYSVDDITLFDKVSSISFCAIMEGRCKDAVLLYRYDSSRLKHKNVFLEDDVKKEIFGEEVESPHFHFQCEDDSVLCLRKKHAKDGKFVYKAGRCNAIDCKHLSNYLMDLDGLSQAEIERLYYHGQHYNMPFLKMAHNNETAQCDFVRVVNKYLKNLPTEERKDLAAIEKWIGKSYAETYDERAHEYVSYDTYTNFGQLIKAVDFIDFVYHQRMDTKDPTANKHLAQVEMLAAGEVMDCIAGVAKKKQTGKKKDNKSFGGNEIETN